MYVFTQRTKFPQMSRWAYTIAGYSCKIVYCPGAQHHVPDLLSRQITAVRTGLDSLDKTALRHAQLRDLLWRDVMGYLEERGLPRRRIPLPLGEFELQNGVIYP